MQVLQAFAVRCLCCHTAVRCLLGGVLQTFSTKQVENVFLLPLHVARLLRNCVGGKSQFNASFTGVCRLLSLLPHGGALPF